VNRQQLAMMDFGFEIRYKNGSKMLAYFLSKNLYKLMQWWLRGLIEAYSVS
jgi:hypothetical protein